SAPAHVLIYRFLGWENEMPLYAHLPLLLKPDGNGKLSKRDGDRLGFPVFPLNWSDPTSGEQSSGYRERGYLPNAFVNMLAFLGWNPGTEQEIFSLEELAHAFSFDHIHKAGARFDPEKAKWFNEQYLRSMPAEGIAKEILPDILTTFQIASDDRRVSPAFLHTAVEILKPRVQFAHEMITQGSYLFQAPTTYDQGVIDKRWKENSTAFFSALCAQFASVADWNKTHIEATVHATASEAGIKPGEMMQLLRVLVSGQPGGVDLMGMLELLGREEIIKRIELALDRIKK
ncbi:MAG: glutamate--tRNA ligase, partial [Flavobacteriales bacterium]